MTERVDRALLAEVAASEEGITSDVVSPKGKNLLVLEFDELVRSIAEPGRRGIDRWFITDKGREVLANG